MVQRVKQKNTLLLQSLYRFVFLISIMTIGLFLPALILDNPKKLESNINPVTVETIDPKLQTKSEQLLNEAIARTKSSKGCVLVLNMNTGAIKTMVSFPKSENNLPVSSAWEPGSVMKTLLVAAAIDSRAVDPTKTTFIDNNSLSVDGFLVTNAISHDPGIITIQDTITKSLNVGAVSILKQMSDNQSTIDEKARRTYYDYLVNRYRFSQKTGVDLPSETNGYVPRPDVGENITTTYANMAIGQSMTVTPLQLASAYMAVLNGGDLYLPQIKENQKKVIQTGVITRETSTEIRKLLRTAFETNTPQAMRNGFDIGGKTGTAHAVSKSGEYKKTIKENGTYIGYVSKGSTEYVMLVRLDGPETATFASAEARELWLKIVTTMIDTNGHFVAE